MPCLYLSCPCLHGTIKFAPNSYLLRYLVFYLRRKSRSTCLTFYDIYNSLQVSILIIVVTTLSLINTSKITEDLALDEVKFAEIGDSIRKSPRAGVCSAIIFCQLTGLKSSILFICSGPTSKILPKEGRELIVPDQRHHHFKLELCAPILSVQFSTIPHQLQGKLRQVQKLCGQVAMIRLKDYHSVNVKFFKGTNISLTTGKGNV